MPQTTLTFIGTDACIPQSDNDTASFMLNDHALVDCGWNAAITMGECGYTPLDLDYVVLTHCHQDHYLGLAGVLFYVGLREPQGRLTVVGPAEDIERVVGCANAYIGWEYVRSEQSDVEVMGVAPDEVIQIGEFTVKTARTQHPVPGLAYRFEDNRTGKTIGISGDTAYLPALAEHFEGVDMLVYEASYGLTDLEVTPNTDHCSARQSATIAREAGVGRLYLVHSVPEAEAEILAAAREIFPETYWPQPGQRVTV